MHFKVAKKQLLDGLNIVSRAVSLNSPLPSLHGILLVVKEDYIQLTASDLDISIQVKIVNSEDSKLEVAETGDIILDSKYILDMIRKIDSDEVEVEIIDGLLTKISGASVNFEINGIKAENYPLIDFSKPENTFYLKSDELKELISQTCFATSDKETRPVLTGLNLKAENGEMKCVATDSYRLAQKIMYMEDNDSFNITIPAKSLNEVAKVLNNDEEIEISISDKKVLFSMENVLIQTRLIEGSYPETSRLIPQNFNYELVVDARDILSAIDRASFIKNEGVSIIKMDISASEIVITSRSSEVGSVETITPVSYVGDNLSISFKGQYVYEAIRALNAFQIKIQFDMLCGPVVFRIEQYFADLFIERKGLRTDIQFPVLHP